MRLLLIITIIITHCSAEPVSNTLNPVRESQYYISKSDPPENCHLNVKKLPKTLHLFQKNWQKLSFFFLNVKFLAIFLHSMAIFRRVRCWQWLAWHAVKCYLVHGISYIKTFHVWMLIPTCCPILLQASRNFFNV